MIFDFTDEEAAIIQGLVVDAVQAAASQIEEYSKLKFRAVDTKQYERIEAEEHRIVCKRVDLIELWEKIANMKEAAEAAINKKEKNHETL